MLGEVGNDLFVSSTSMSSVDIHTNGSSVREVAMKLSFDLLSSYTHIREGGFVTLRTLVGHLEGSAAIMAYQTT